MQETCQPKLGDQTMPAMQNEFCPVLAALRDLSPQSLQQATIRISDARFDVRPRPNPTGDQFDVNVTNPVEAIFSKYGVAQKG
jgi:hypothetical protein